VLSDPNHEVVVGDRIEEVGVSGDFIVGRTVDPGEDAYPCCSFPVGYFVVDTPSGRVTAGMTRDQVIDITHKPLPSLYSPSHWGWWSMVRHPTYLLK
jgi:hypothetical protein